MNASQIWYILNEAVRGKRPVYEIANRCVGLPDETIYELADKMEADMHSSPNSYERWIKHKQKQRGIKKANEL